MFVEVAEGLLDHLLPLGEGEQRLALLRVAHRRHDHLVEEVGGRLDQLDVSVVDRVERSRIQHLGHRRHATAGACPDYHQAPSDHEALGDHDVGARRSAWPARPPTRRADRLPGSTRAPPSALAGRAAARASRRSRTAGRAGPGPIDGAGRRRGTARPGVATTSAASDSPHVARFASMARRAFEVGVDEGRPRRASRQRLDPHRAAAREEVEHRGLVDGAEAAEGVEGGLAARGPGWVACRVHRGHQATTPGRSRDDAHLGDRTAGAGTVRSMSDRSCPTASSSFASTRATSATPSTARRPSACTTSSRPSTRTTPQRVAVLTGDEQAFSRRRQPPRPAPAARQRAARSDPTAALQAGDRGHRGLVRGRRCGAGGVVRPAGGGHVVADRLPRAALGRAADRRRHLPTAPDRRAGPGPRPDPHRPGDRHRGGRADGLPQPGRPRWRGARHRDRAGRRDRVAPVAGRRERPPSVYAGLGRPPRGSASPSRTSWAATRSSPTASATASPASTTTRPPGIAERSARSDATSFRGRGWRRWGRCGPAPGPRSRASQEVVRQSSPSTRCQRRRLDSTARRRGETPGSPDVEARGAPGTRPAPAPTRRRPSISRARQKAFASPARSSLSASGVRRQQRGSRRRSCAFTASGMLPT